MGRDREYGWVKFNGRSKLAHRVAWMLAGKPLAKHKQLHHRCENKDCCNVNHLELVTDARHRFLHRNTHCKYGHEMIGRNVFWRNRGGGRLCRDCRTCHNARNSRNARKARERRAVID